MFGFGASEALFIALFGIIVLGPKRIQDLSRHAGRALRELSLAKENLVNELNSAVDSEDYNCPDSPHDTPEIYKSVEGK